MGYIRRPEAQRVFSEEKKMNKLRIIDADGHVCEEVNAIESRRMG
jgi:hypothetical protein